MRTIECNLFSFDELSDTAKKKAIESNFDINVSYEWWESTYEEASNIGLQIDGFNLDRNRHATGSFNLSACEVAQNIFNNHGEQCETFKTATKFMDEWQPIFNLYMDESSEQYESSGAENEMADLEWSFLRSLLDDYSVILQEEYEYLCSDEAIIETIQANEYEFTEDGELA